MDLSGVFIPAATPFDPVTGDLDVVGHRSNLRKWLEHPIRGIVLCGSTGEAVYLDTAERIALMEASRDLVPEDRLLLVGTGLESTRGTIALCAMAAERGADAVLVQPPAFYKPAMDSAVLRDHFRAVADASPVPVIIYQVPPRFSTVEVVSGLVVELSGHENIVGIKDSRGDLEAMGDLVRSCRAGFQVLSGSGLGFFAALEVGAVGGILGVANVAPGLSGGVFNAVRAGNGPEAGRLQETLDPLHREIVAGKGVPGVKAALDHLGYRGGSPRPPLPRLPEAGRDRIRELLDAAGLLGAAV